MDIFLRENILPPDRKGVLSVLRETGFFYPHEIEVALELFDDALLNGTGSPYRFLLAEAQGRFAGYACYGPISMVEGRFDLYWVAVDPSLQGRGIGKLLILGAEERMLASGCRHVYIDTSSRGLYLPTRRFYERCGYTEVARIPKFFGEEDDKLVFMKTL